MKLIIYLHCKQYNFIMIMNSRNALDILQGYGIHPSVQRIAIMDYLLNHRTHPTVDDVYVALSREIPTLSKTTVYNTLRLFADYGAVQMLTIDEKKLCFDGDVTPHAHFMCKCCGRLFDVALPSELEYIRLPEEGYMVDETHLYYKGTCKSCVGKAEVKA